MKKLIFIFIASSAIFAASCKKTSNSVNNAIGFWSGSKGASPPYTIFMGLLFKENFTGRSYASSRSADTASALSVDFTYIFRNDSVFLTFGSGSIVGKIVGNQMLAVEPYTGDFTLTKQ